MSSRDGNWELYMVSTAGGAPVRLTNDVANDGLPEWSPDGRSIAFASSRGGRWGIWVIGMDGSNPKLLIEPEGPLDGHVRQEPEFASRGWVDENISWVR
jgi:Tol biopolymer transport system component